MLNKLFNIKELQHVTGIAKLSELHLGLSLHFKDVYVLKQKPCTFSWWYIFTSVIMCNRATALLLKWEEPKQKNIAPQTSKSQPKPLKSH